MPVDSAQYVGNLDETQPVGSDSVYEGDDNIRAVKKAARQSFPYVTGAVSATHTELSRVTGVTSPVQTQLDAKAPIASPAFTGTPTAPTPTAGDSSTTIPTTAFVQAALAGLVASNYPTVPTYVTGTTHNATAGQWVVLRNVAASEVTFPASPASGDIIDVTWENGLITNSVNGNGKTIMGESTFPLDAVYASPRFRFNGIEWKLV